ncbi:type II secretion system F family protein [Bacteriovoracaceae bacterium]|nr:type II secretion system F family protein [Bacteriovoracaceae bacterium]
MMLNILGQNGIIALIGFVVFAFCFKYSVGIFSWVENQTIGTRTYIMEKLELLFIEVDPDRITYTLLFLSIGLSSFVLIVLGVFVSWILGFFVAVIVAFVGFKIPKPIINFMVEKRIKEFSGQMVDGLTLLSNGIRAGLSVPQSIGMVVNEMPNPISQEFNLILQQNKIGVPLEECFDNFAKRIPTEDNEMFVSSINILRETGGNLAEVFDTIVNVIRERIRLQQKVDTYTAQGMFQGATIFAMPFAITAIFAASDPQSVVRMFTTPLGIILSLAALLLDCIGGFLILKIVKIKI